MRAHAHTRTQTGKESKRRVKGEKALVVEELVVDLKEEVEEEKQRKLMKATAHVSERLAV